MSDPTGGRNGQPERAPTHRSFEIRKRNTNGEARSFDLNGEVFRFYPDRVNAMVAADLPGMRVNMNSAPMWELFESMMPDDYERFRRMIRSPQLMFEADDLRSLLEWMTQEAAERPT